MTAAGSGPSTASQSTVLIEAVGLHLAYGRRAVLQDVSLQVRAGEFWFFIGPNGGGKTTLFRAMLGALSPRAGSIATHLARDRIGYVPQQCDFNPALPTTLREFVLLGLVGLNVDRKERCRRLTWALECIGLAGLESADYWSLSGGQRQRALVARALVRQPALLLADEPTDGLDVSAQNTLFSSLADLRRTEDLTLVFVAHDLALAGRYATHVGLFHGGHVLAGAASTVITAPNLQKSYLLPPDLCEKLAVAAEQHSLTAGTAR